MFGLPFRKQFIGVWLFSLNNDVSDWIIQVLNTYMPVFI